MGHASWEEFLYFGGIQHYIPRIADHQLARDLAEWPAVLITGPRDIGKTTTALRQSADALRLDTRVGRQLTDADPDAALEGRPTPLLIDEWQLVPDVLGSVKRAVDHHPAAGRFLVTGSARNDLLEDMWPATGRLLNLRMRGITGRERFGNAGGPTLFDRWALSENRFRVPPDPPDLAGYLDIALTGGFPRAINAPNEGARRRWFRSYLEHTVTRDIPDLTPGGGRRKDPLGLQRYLEVYAHHTAGVLTAAGLNQDAKVSAKTGEGYRNALVTLGLIGDIRAWRSNRLKRLVATPRRHLIDTGLAGFLVETDVAAARRDPDMSGRLMDSYVTAQLRVEAEASNRRVGLFHLRTHRGERKIDLVAEFGGQVAAFEIKSGPAPRPSDARHLAWLRDQLPAERFAGGVVFHTGPWCYPLGDQIEAVPIAGLWT